MGNTPNKSERKGKLSNSIGVSPFKNITDKFWMMPTTTRDIVIKEKRSSLQSNYHLTNDFPFNRGEPGNSKLYDCISNMSTLMSSLSNSMSSWK